MKKALALVLALVLALSMAVSAFAAGNPVVLEPVSTISTVNKIDLEKNILKEVTNAKGEEVFVAPAEGGVYYFLLNSFAKLYNVATSANGSVTTEIVEFDPTTMKAPTGIVYLVTDGVSFWDAPESLTAEEVNADYNAQFKKLGDKYFEAPQYKKDGVATEFAIGDYEYAVALAKYLSDGAEVLGKYKAVPCTVVDGAYALAYINVVKVTVAENYSAAYTEGDFKVTATTDKLGKKAVAFEADVISDVTIFEYEQVKFAAKEKAALEINAKGYSDYETALKGYGDKYVVNDLRKVDNATVVSTTAFRAIEGKDLYVVDADETVLVTVKAVAAAQKGVNFAFYSFVDVDENNVPCNESKKPIDAIAFGFLGNQVIASDFDIDVDLGINAYELREKFGLKVEEDDIICYYVVDEKGEVVKTIKVDYMVDDIAEDIEFTINGKAGETLGEYEIVLEVPASETVEGEANPNTGAESVVGVVAALAVVSVATAAAVSLKK